MASPPEPSPPAPAKDISKLSTQEKVALFRRLFRSRKDVYPVRWESKASGKSGYAPACANEWREGVCDKRQVKCADCSNRQLVPLSDSVIYDHLTGKHTIGVYPLLEDDTCHFLAVDFDEAEWRSDARAFVQSCEELGIPIALEISRSGKGAHAWTFFTNRVPARDARRLGTAIISLICARTRQLALSSYDRLFPNQDRLPKGGFGNLIALPLQKEPRDKGYSLFVDSGWHAYADPWAFLRMPGRYRRRYRPWCLRLRPVKWRYAPRPRSPRTPGRRSGTQAPNPGRRRQSGSRGGWWAPDVALVDPCAGLGRTDPG